MTEIKKEKYLEQIIASDGSNTENVKFRAGKGIGMWNKDESILENNPGGNFHFENAVMMRNAFFISLVLLCSEVWYNVLETEVKKLEMTDESLLRKSLGCLSQVKTKMLYLDLGITPRRVIYLQNILKQRKQASLIFQILMAQMEQPRKLYWATEVLKDLVELDI